MRRNVIFVTVITIALLLGAWSNVIAAAFCPRFTSDHGCCPKRSSTQAESSSHSMEHMDSCEQHKELTEDSQESSQAEAEQSNEQESGDFIGSLTEEAACTHCLSHSQRPRFGLSDRC